MLILEDIHILIMVMNFSSIISSVMLSLMLFSIGSAIFTSFWPLFIAWGLHAEFYLCRRNKFNAGFSSNTLIITMKMMHLSTIMSHMSQSEANVRT